jgi:hypothetical protein
MKRKRRTPVNLNRIRFPSDGWIPVNNSVFECVFPFLTNKRSAQLYMAMYNMAQHSRTGEFSACLQDLARVTACDPRTVRKCIIELSSRNVVLMSNWRGTSRSRTRKPRFRIPLFDQGLVNGHWTPVPRFLVTHYLPKMSGALILLILLYHQHMSWRNDCWPGVGRLERLTNWSKRTVYHTIHSMGNRKRWDALNTGMPRPLAVTWEKAVTEQEFRHFSVRAVNYYFSERQNCRVVGLSEEFGKAFNR